MTRTKTVFSVIDLFERYNISYSPDGGSLIGVVRCGSLLRYEYDFDFHIYNATQPAMKPLFEEWVLKENMKGGVLTHNKRLADARDEIEHETCTKARQEMRDGPCKIQSDLMVGTTGCNGSDAEELGIHNNFNSSTSNTFGPFSP